MTVANNFLPFAQGVSANVDSQSSYSANPNTVAGQQPGVASSSFNNKVLRQANAITSQLAQYLANNNNTDVLDNANTGQLLALLVNAFQLIAPSYYTFTSGTSTFKVPYLVQCASANATAGAVYQDGSSNQVTITNTVSAGVQLQVTGTNPPATGTGTLTLTKVSGTGDATITYYAVRTPLSMRIKAVGGGSGGGATGGSAPTAGTSTTFDSFLTAGGASAPGNGLSAPGSPGVPTLTTSATVIQLRSDYGARGHNFAASTYSYNAISGGAGASSPYGGAGAGGTPSSAGYAANANTGSGGGGQGDSNTGCTGGSSGAYIECIVLNPTGTYSVTVGTAGVGGGSTGGSGGSGFCEVEVNWQ